MPMKTCFISFLEIFSQRNLFVRKSERQGPSNRSITIIRYLSDSKSCLTRTTFG